MGFASHNKAAASLPDVKKACVPAGGNSAPGTVGSTSTVVGHWRTSAG